MPETDSTNFMIAISFTTAMIVLIVSAYAWHLVISSRRLKQIQEKLKALAARLSEEEEETRKRIAEDLHDRIGEILITSSQNIDELKKKSASEEINRGLDTLSQTIQKFTNGTRSLIFDLIPSILYDIGFGEAVEDLAADLSKKYRVTIRVEDKLENRVVNQEVAIFLYKAIHEFVANAIKHGGAEEVLVILWQRDGKIEVVVQDNGSGFVTGSNNLTLKTDSGFGLFNIKNRAEFYKGSVRMSTAAILGGGQIAVSVPVSLQEEKQG